MRKHIPANLINYFWMMININYPKPDFKIEQKSGTETIFDSIRKKWLLLTPEEWVRQNFIHYLIQVKDYPSSLIAVEKEFELGELKKRFDILVYDRNHQPWMMIECKAMDVALNENVLNQLLRYHISLPVTFLIITNGNATYGWQKIEDQLSPLTNLPDFEMQ